MARITIEKQGYVPVECDVPLPCPFCGGAPELAQLAHTTMSQRIGRSRKYKSVQVAIVSSTATLTADTFWFRCRDPDCGCQAGSHHTSAQAASEAWNRRHPQAPSPLAALAYRDVLLTEEESAELQRLSENLLCRPRFPVSVDHIIPDDKSGPAE